MSFIGKRVPAVQIFTAAHADYHRPSDTADKIGGAGLVKVATFVKEAVAYLAERPDPLTNTIAKAEAAPAAPPPPSSASGRRVCFGTVPDFAFPGPGARVGGTVRGSPAEKAGDVLLKIDDRPVATLQAFSDLLKTLTAGQTVSVLLKRGEREMTVQVTVVER